jgi:hypothetical protein
MSEPSSFEFRPLRLAELKQESADVTNWLWEGYLAAGNLTLLTSQWKTGKTTLLSVLLDRMKNGGLLVGLPVKPGKAIVLSEEPPALWLERSHRFDFAEHVTWLCRPFDQQPRKEQWHQLIEHLLALHKQVGLSLVAFDTLATLFPAGSEHSATAMMAALLPLRRLTSLGMSVLINHHPRKHASPDGQSSRGSGALLGHVDILMELHWYAPSAEDNRRRRLLAWSRHEATPRQLLIELSADSRDYLVVTDAEDEELSPLREVLWRVLESSPTKRTRAEIVDNWLPDYPKPPSTSLWRLLERCVERGELKRDGTGLKAQPYRYWLPSLEERWETDPVAHLQQQIADACRATEEQLLGR